MIRLYNGAIPSHGREILAVHLYRTRGLIRDLEALRQGILPTPEFLAEAPIIDQWDMALRPARVLRWTLASGAEAVSQPLYSYDCRGGWCHDEARLMRLGEAAPDAEQ
ncbi:hypothetical protein SAMN05216548_12815 [Faunimonas pinastri]|uniref:Uncharacterized protein n=1 Tax=Faunimonas pinastri TaxID=1855383 RepID=A0A1H9QG65_9HYPH|nr:hypothetical protein [Faunimonas pinastri]SER59551.1 hypothetical protein SAMN05216548_12815 [Faunimonas pinastri]